MEKEKAQEVIIDVTEEDYQEALASGIEPEYALKPGRHVFRRGGFLERHPDYNPAKVEIKVWVKLCLDYDILNFFKQRTAQSGAASYQEQITDVLRRFVEQESQGPKKD